MGQFQLITTDYRLVIRLPVMLNIKSGQTHEPAEICDSLEIRWLLNKEAKGSQKQTK